ncbi:hypothetical protein GWK47_003563 [Chionoecetes opilio]|uniref:Uncharacterized protein n=1 Tax=Chionoecetes opilio TaxID=41210 RepID=A0A8J5D4H0_CHIOP|nr:hypothetical protein GWK47_003563 [Chionoecetes opilio]
METDKGSRKIQDKDEGSDSSRSQSDVALIPANIHSAFLNGWIYASGKRTPVTSAKYGLGEFCRYLVHTEISKFPASYKVKGPLHTSHVSYASVVKKETINVHDEILYNRSPVAQSYCIDEVSSSVMHTEKQSQGIESPDKHKNWINADLEDNNKTPSSQHSVGAVKASEQNKNIPDKNLTHLPRIKETLSEKPVNMSRKTAVT